MSDKRSESGNPVPVQIGKYQIRGMVGQGAVGIVYRGYDADIDRLVAVKVLHPHLRNDDFIIRFKQEARAAARCVHRNIVTVFDFGIHDESPYMVMEYMDGIDLRSFLATKESLSLKQSCDIILYVLQALDFAHRNGVIHRDIKPANILLLDNGLVKVTDFGVARIDSSDLTHVGDVIGTPLYMSPEARMGSIVDNRTDLFNTGVVLLELLCQMRPKEPLHEPKDAENLLRQSPLEDGDRADFMRIFKKALAPSPADRYQTAQDFAKELRTIISPNQLYQPDAKTLAADVLKTRTIVQQAVSAGQKAKTQSQVSSSQFTLTIEESKQLGNILSTYLGPVASYLVKSASGKCRNFDELVGKLADKIPSQGERRQFVKTLQGKSLGTVAPKSVGARASALASETVNMTDDISSEVEELPPEQLEQVTRDLVFYLGPVASSLVKRSARHAADLHQLYLLVAEHINNIEERQHFLKGK